jgi:signal transduction histidine kinase
MRDIKPADRNVDTAERYRTLLEINNAIITHLEKGDLFRATCGALQGVIPYDAAGVAIYEPDLDALRFFAIEGDVTSDRFAVGDLMNRLGCCFGFAFDNQQPVLRGDLRVERGFPTDDRLRAAGMRSYCTVPMILHGKSIGGLSVVSRLPHQYTSSDAELLQKVADQLALAISNMRAYEEIALLRKHLSIENHYLRSGMREAESHALLAENAALMGRFAAALTHELNSPLGALRSALDSSRVLAERDQKTAEACSEDRDLREDLRRTMLKATDRLVDVVSRVKRLTNLDRSDVLTVDLNDLVRDVMDLVRPTLREQVDVELELGSLPLLHARPQQISALLMAVIQNAIDESNGARRVRITTRRDDRMVEVLVQDDGRGLSAEELESIFEPSFHVKGERIVTGNWSLFSAHQVARAHGGRIEIRSLGETGTSLSIQLPLARRSELGAESASAQAEQIPAMVH